MRDIKDAVIVITGASSGIGRAAAHAFASRGATVIVAARSDDKLEDVAHECREGGGGECLAITCDTTSPEDVQALADQAVESFGRIDVWVNNAAVTGFGRVDEMPYETYRKIIETNLLGYVHGTRAAVGQFRRQGRGVLINVSSVAGKVGQPLTSAYCASKFGIVGLSDSVRMELRNEPEIHVCTVLPPSIDTPLFQRGANYAGREAKPIPPVYSAADVARVIVRLARYPRREVAIGPMGKFLVALQRFSPALAENMMARQVSKEHFKKQPEAATSGNVFEPAEDEYEVSGGWRESESSPGSRVIKAAVGTGILLTAACAAYSLAKAVMSKREGEFAWEEERELFEAQEGQTIPEGAFVVP